MTENMSQEAVDEYRGGFRNEVKIFLAVLSMQPEPIRAELARLRREGYVG